MYYENILESHYDTKNRG